MASIITANVTPSELNLGETLALPISLEVKLPLEQSILSLPLSILILSLDHSRGSSDFENDKSNRESLLLDVKLLIESLAINSFLVPKSSSYETIE